MDSIPTGTRLLCLVRNLTFAAVFLVAAVAPVSVDLETGEVSTAVAVCQEGADCMPKYQWRCVGYVNECNMRYSVCREGGPTFPPDPDEGRPPLD